MNDILRDRLLRKLDTLPDEKAYQVLDYVEFLESKYAERQAGAPAFQRAAETLEGTLRAGRVPVTIIRGTMPARRSPNRDQVQQVQRVRPAVQQMLASLVDHPALI